MSWQGDIFCKMLWGGEEWPAGKIIGFRGKKGRKEGKGKKSDKREKKPPKNFPPPGCKIAFCARGGRGNNMIHLHNIYAWSTEYVFWLWLSITD